MRAVLSMSLLAAILGGCSGNVGTSNSDGGSMPGVDSGTPPGSDGGTVDAPVGPPHPIEGWPTPNEYSWNGSWNPSASELAALSLLDNEYNDGHDGSPILPPGSWDYNDGDNDLANYRNFESHIGTFAARNDGASHQFGWSVTTSEANPEWGGAGAFYEGDPGADIIDLGPTGFIHGLGFGEGDLGEGPDVLAFGTSTSLDYRTGTSIAGGLHDDDLVVAGCTHHTDGAFNVVTTTIHTGPGADWVFVTDIDRAGIDLGNGGGGRTDTIDPLDGDDLVVVRGNSHDFRLMGGRGNDTFVWYVDDNVQTTAYLGPDFFGGGSKDGALWDDAGIDRLVLAVPTSTTLVTEPATPDGGLLVMPTDGGFIDDPPTAADPYATYCVECGTSPTGRKTVTLEYNRADGEVRTGYFNITAFEEVQVGIGAGARVYHIDDTTGTATLDTSATPTVPPDYPTQYCE